MNEHNEMLQRIARNRYRHMSGTILALRLAGESLSQIARTLNADQMPPPSGHGRWYPQTVKRALEAWAA